MKLKSGATSCHHCGNDYSFYVIHTASGSTSYFYGFNGDDADNTHLWDGVRLKSKRRLFAVNAREALVLLWKINSQGCNKRNE
ncbi:hypothetical protein [Proteus hauseri]|uniref:hypothetical protein n=1 Tax=Proteus hauseri TaxID=183417 RepID=UPI0010094BEE|nr:hypothetical protein [Proteus hauseri]QAV22032.1 hypothetical protein PH4a_01140 [Proteus hauseri]